MTGLLERVGRAMAESLNYRRDFEFWEMMHRFGDETLCCPVDSRVYVKAGWFYRHMFQTGHWRRTVAK